MKLTQGKIKYKIIFIKNNFLLFKSWCIKILMILEKIYYHNII